MPLNRTRNGDYLYGQLRGEPGFRTRGDRSGYDPVDTPAEEARMEGIFFRNLVTLRARTRNPFYLVMMFVFGVLPFGMLMFFLVHIGETEDPISALTPYLCVLTALSAAITANFVVSILELVKVIPRLESPREAARPDGIRKKQPKRRKDYK